MSTLGLIAVILPRESCARVGVGREADRLADRDRRQLLLRQKEVDVDGIDRLQGHQLVAGVQVLARVRGADAELAGECGADALLVDDRRLLRDLRPAALELGGVVVELRLADDFGRELRLVALVDGGGEVRGRLERALQGDVGIRVELDQQLVRLHLVAGLEFDAAHESGHLAGDVDAAHGAQGSHGVQPRLPLLVVGLDRAHGRRRDRARRHVLLHHVAHEGVVAHDAAQQQAHRHEHDRHALFHGFSVAFSSRPQPPPSDWNKAAVSA